jgi:hypothetical protein
MFEVAAPCWSRQLGCIALGYINSDFAIVIRPLRVLRLPIHLAIKPAKWMGHRLLNEGRIKNACSLTPDP